jgi:2-dehydro-3-deoxyphosphooctonate aldolase (KDO 8-P synthase)
METHNDPTNAMSDSNTVLDLKYLEFVLTQAKAIHETRLNLIAELGEDKVHSEVK